MPENNVAETWAAEFGMRPSVENTKYLMEILATTKNPHKHRHQDLAALTGSIDKVGFKNVIALWQNPETGRPEVIYGGGRIKTGDSHGYERLPVVWIQDFDKAKAKFLRVADNRVPQLAPAYDDEILIDHLKDLKLENFEYDFLKLEKYDKFLTDDLAADDPIFQSIAPGYEELVNGPVARKVDGTVESAPFEVDKPGDLDKPPVAEIEPVKNDDYEMGGIVFPSDPVWGIPVLSLKYQAEKVTKPIVKWGEVGRKDKSVTGGIWHFYVKDYKFETLYYNDPNAPMYADPYAMVLPNYSVREFTPYSWIMGQTFKKFWLGRYWQSKGFRIFVDLNVRLDADQIELVGCPINFLGVPRGWRAYATRGYNSSADYLKLEYQWACKWAESDDIIFMVIGGGKEVQRVANEYQWTWIPERMDVVWNPELDDGLPTKVPTSEFKNIKK